MAKSCVSRFQAEGYPATAPAPNHRLGSFGCAESCRFQPRLPHPTADCDIPFLSFLLSGSGFVKQPDLRWGALGRTLYLGIFRLILCQVFQNLPDHRRVFHAGDDLHRTLALLAGFDVDVAYRDVGQGREQERKL